MENIKYTYTYALATKCLWASMNGIHDDSMFHTATASKRKWILFSFSSCSSIFMSTIDND